METRRGPPRRPSDQRRAEDGLGEVGVLEDSFDLGRGPVVGKPGRVGVRDAQVNDPANAGALGGADESTTIPDGVARRGTRLRVANPERVVERIRPLETPGEAVGIFEAKLNAPVTTST